MSLRPRTSWSEDSFGSHPFLPPRLRHGLSCWGAVVYSRIAPETFCQSSCLSGVLTSQVATHLLWVLGLSLGVSGLHGRRFTFEHLPSPLPSLLSVNFCLLLCVCLSYMAHTHIYTYMMHVYIFIGQWTTSWTSLLPPLWVLEIKLSL